MAIDAGRHARRDELPSLSRQESDPLRLSQLLDSVTAPLPAGMPDVEILDIAYDSRLVTPGGIFVAVPSVGGDARSGGSLFMDQAASRGAVAIVAHEGAAASGIPITSVPDARKALGLLSAEFFGHPSNEMALFAVTGTDGKTTTTYLLEQILSAAGYMTGLIGTVETKIGDERLANPDRVTTPESLDVQRLLRRMRDRGVTHGAMEASSHALALQRLRGCRFSGCAITNVTGDHIEFHGSMEAYIDAKASLFSDVGAGAPAVLNRDDPIFERMAGATSGSVLTYGTKASAELRAEDLNPTATSTRFRLTHDRSVETEVQLPGVFNVYNALAAAGLALTAGLSLEAIGPALARAQPPPGRMQRINEGQPFDVLVDYAHTPNAFRSALEAVRGSREPDGRVIAVIGAAGDRDRAKRPLLGSIALAAADYVYITNEDPCGEPPEQIMAEVARDLPPGAQGNRFELESDRGRAISRAVALAEPGDAVLILGKGHEQSIEVNGQKLPWSDVEAARRAVEERM